MTQDNAQPKLELVTAHTTAAQDKQKTATIEEPKTQGSVYGADAYIDAVGKACEKYKELKKQPWFNGRQP